MSRSSGPPWRSRLETRFAHSRPDVAARMRFMPMVDAQHFAALLAAADVVLDSLHCGDGYTSCETIWAQTPFVTQRSNYLRGRITAGLCSLLGLDECVATNAADYAARALAMASERRVREEVITKLAMRKRRLLSLDETVLPAYSAFFQRALAAAARAAACERLWLIPLV